MGKTYRQYKGEEFQDKDTKNQWSTSSCRHGGSCSWCEGNRTFRNKREQMKIDYDNYEHYEETD